MSLKKNYILKSDFGLIPFGKLISAIRNNLVSIWVARFQNSKGRFCQPSCRTTNVAYSKGICSILRKIKYDTQVEMDFEAVIKDFANGKTLEMLM